VDGVVAGAGTEEGRSAAGEVIEERYGCLIDLLPKGNDRRRQLPTIFLRLGTLYPGPGIGLRHIPHLWLGTT
jgi:hypothetical protein